jgi:hypothetical protein
MTEQSEVELTKLAQQILLMTESATADHNVAGRELRQLLKFIVKMVQVVDQAFQNVYLTLTEIKLLKPSDLGTEAVTEIERDIELIFSRSWYRDTEEICSRLHHLTRLYEQQIAPIVNKLAQHQTWQQVFQLIDQYEGRIIFLVRDSVEEISKLLESLHTPEDMKTISQLATQKRKAIHEVLQVLRDLQNQILGLSEAEGFLEMTDSSRTAISQSIHVLIDKVTQINTAGGAYVAGDVNTGGDFVGRDQAIV